MSRKNDGERERGGEGRGVLVSCIETETNKYRSIHAATRKRERGIDR